MGTESRISVRIPVDLKKRLEAAKKITGLDEPLIVKHSVEAFCRYVEQYGESAAFPLELRPPVVRGLPAYPDHVPQPSVAAEEYKPKKRKSSS